MGIHGLTTYMDEYFSDKLKTVPVTGRLVIDAMSLCYSIYNQVDWLHGGQYWELRQRVKTLFTALTRSGIEPIVVFDGIDYSGDKFHVKKQRMENTERGINTSLLNFVDGSHDDGYSTCSKGVIPLFAEKVFIETLRELSITFLYADGDADGDCVSVANYYQCPVMSNDSDYYMFNLDAGYISFDKFYWKNVPITGRLYKLSDFISHFKFPDQKLALLIPAVMGNDYIEREFVYSLQRDVPVLRQGHEVSNVDKTTRLIRYLSGFQSIDNFKEYITKEWDKKDMEELIDKYDIAEEMYTVKPMAVEEYMRQTDLETANDTALPPWLIRQYRIGCFSTAAMMVLVKNGASLSPVIDNPRSVNSALLVSRDLRGCLYRIMAPYLKGVVKESIITGGEWKTDDVQFASESLCLPSIAEMDHISVRIEALCRTMECSLSILDVFEDKWKLPVLALCYWVMKARPSMEVIKSLVACHIVCSRDKDPLSVIPLRIRPSHRRYKCNWLAILHSFTMWQCIYHDAMKINDVLTNPLPFQTPALLFDGKLAMHFATIRDLDHKISEILSHPLEDQLYKSFMSTVGLYVMTKSKPKKKKKASKVTTTPTPSTTKGRQPVQQPTVATTNRFSALTLDSDNSSSDGSDNNDDD